MNIFKRMNALLGEPEPRDRAILPREFYTLAAEIKAKLGRKAWLLERYLCLLMKCVVNWRPANVVEEGNRFYTYLWNMCLIALDMVDDRMAWVAERKKEPFYPRVQEYIAANPLDNDCEHTRAGLYTLLLAEEYLLDTIPRELANATRAIDMVELDGYFRQIGENLSFQQPMEELNALIAQHFVRCTVASLWIQSFAHGMAATLSTRDDETGKELLLLLLEYPTMTKGNHLA